MQSGNEVVEWDPSQFPPALDPLQKIYVLFLLAAVCVAIVKMVALWTPAPPFRLSRQAHNPGYVQHLRRACEDFKQWMICVLLSGAAVAASGVYERCQSLLEAKATGNVVLLFAIRDSAAQVSSTFFVALLLFLLQWHVQRRVERLAH
jgi:hypothetical protein